MSEYHEDGHTVYLVAQDGELHLKAECPHPADKSAAAAKKPCHQINGSATGLCIVEHTLWNNTDPEAFSEISDQVIFGPAKLRWKRDDSRNTGMGRDIKLEILPAKENPGASVNFVEACNLPHFDVILTEETFKVRPFLAFMARAKGLSENEIQILMHYPSREAVHDDIENYMKTMPVAP